MLFTRRRFLKAALMASGSLFIPPVLGKKSNLLKGKKIIIIGAGISGLAAARELVNQGASVKILESSNYIGGRIKTDWSLGKDAPFEFGAGWIHGPSQKNPIKQLADKSGCKYFLTNDDNVSTFDPDGSEWSDQKFEMVYQIWEKALEKVDEELELDDKRSLKEAIQDVYPIALQHPGAAWAFSAYTEFDKGASIERVSAVYHDDDKMFNKPDVIIKNGYETVVNQLSKNLDINLNQDVNRIDINDNKGVRIQTNNEEYTGDFVICSVPLGILKAKKIKFKPPLPRQYLKSISKIGFGSVTKIAMKFKRPFWDTSTQYFGVSTEEKGRWNYWLNYRTFSHENILLGLSVGDYALVADKMNNEVMKRDALQVLKGVWGSSVTEPIETISTRWSQNKNFLGAYSYPSPGTSPKDYEQLATPINDKLFFCGEHTDFNYSATTHGALISGLRTANDIIKSINS